MDALEIMIITIFTYVSLFILARVVGRREISQLSFFDFISIALGTISAATFLYLETPVYIGFVVLLTWGVMTYASMRLSRQSLPARKLLEGEPIVVIHTGKILEQNLIKASYNMHDLPSVLREQACTIQTKWNWALLNRRAR